jgi:uncharacterized protein DUF4157
MSRKGITANKKAKGAPVPKTNITGFPQPAGSRVKSIVSLQRALGNRAVERLYRSGLIQTKLTIGAPHDSYEQEAGRVADPVMRMPEPSLQKKCAGCEEDDKLNVRKKSETSSAPISSVPDAFVSSLETGQPLDRATRDYFEPWFGADFSHVRVHAGRRASESASSINARAYTLGSKVVFGAGQYRPETGEGKRLIAHELTHVVQQSSAEGWPAGQSNGKRGLSRTSPTATSFPVLQRRLQVRPTDMIPMPAGQAGPPVSLPLAVQGLLAETCPDGNFRVNTTTGNVTPSQANFCEWHAPLMPDVLEADLSSTPTGCRCICDVINHPNTTNIAFHAGPPGTTPVGPTGTGPGSPTIFADPRFQGQYLIGGRWVDIPFHLIISHELCGHALPLMRGTQVARGPAPAGGTPPHERRAVDVERDIAAEHRPPLPRRPEDYAGGARERP